MKAILFFLAISLIGSGSLAQSKGNIQLYGFEQRVSGGKAPEPDPQTGLRTAGKVGKNYYLYAVSPTRIYPVELWVQGNRYNATLRTITKTPVEYGDERNIGAPKKVLVPATSQKVVQLSLTPAVKSKIAGKKVQELAQTNELVVVYKQNGKFYYQILSKLADLDVASLE